MATSMQEGPSAISRSRCRYHPDRDGVGICMKCRTVICTECSTRLDGINHCAVCVARLARQRPTASRGTGTGLRLLGVLLLMAVMAAGTYGALYMLYLWS